MPILSCSEPEACEYVKPHAPTAYDLSNMIPDKPPSRAKKDEKLGSDQRTQRES